MKSGLFILVFIPAYSSAIQYRVGAILSQSEPGTLVHNGELGGSISSGLPATKWIGQSPVVYPSPRTSVNSWILGSSGHGYSGESFGYDDQARFAYAWYLDPVSEQYTFLPPYGDYESESYEIRDMNRSDEIVSIITNDITSGKSAHRWSRDPGNPNGWRRDQLVGTGGQTEVYGISEDGTMFGRSNIDGIVWHQDLSHVVLQRPSNGNARAYGRDALGHIYGIIAQSAGSAGTEIMFALWDTEYSSPTTSHAFTGLGPIFHSGNNSRGQSVGFASFQRPDNTYDMFGWLEDPEQGLVRLNDLLTPTDAAHYNISSALSIDDAGNITARSNQGYVYLQPVPEPGSLAGLALGAVGLLKKRRRKASASA